MRKYVDGKNNRHFIVEINLLPFIARQNCPTNTLAAHSQIEAELKTMNRD